METVIPERRRFGKLDVEIHEDGPALGRAAAAWAADRIRAAVDERGEARVILATGNSQLAFLASLASRTDVPWSETVLFHMDEYVGVSADHSASFRRYLHERIVDDVSPKEFHGMRGDEDPDTELVRYAALLAEAPIDLTCMGIGENGHLAFNDPPEARFDDPAPIRVVRLDETSRMQQVGEGHFGAIDDVPTHAITLTIPTLLSARDVIVVVPEQRKSEAVRRALLGDIDPSCPASILRRSPHARLYLEWASASGMTANG